MVGVGRDRESPPASQVDDGIEDHAPEGGDGTGGREMHPIRRQADGGTDEHRPAQPRLMRAPDDDEEGASCRKDQVGPVEEGDPGHDARSERKAARSHRIGRQPPAGFETEPERPQAERDCPHPRQCDEAEGRDDDESAI